MVELFDMKKRIKAIGRRSGSLVVVAKASPLASAKTNTRYYCKCDCGKIVTHFLANIIKGSVSSCGCKTHENYSIAATKHGMRYSEEYYLWASMIQRCTNPNSTAYYKYGKRGIQICKKWFKFEGFFKDMGKRPSNKHTLERVDNNSGYCKENCIWATWNEQARNKRNSIKINYKGKTLPLATISELTGIKYATLLNRLNTNKSQKQLFFKGNLPKRNQYT